MQRALGYDQVAIVPRHKSNIPSRSKVDTSISFGTERFNISLGVPLIASPMPDVCNGEMAAYLYKLGSFGIIHRFQSIENQLQEFAKASKDALVGCAIGINEDYKERFYKLLEANCQVFCIDVANGFNTRLVEPIKLLKKHGVFVIAGNIASAEGFQWLAELGVDAIRSGIAGGSVCATKTETGIFYPMFSCIQEIAEFKYKTNCKSLIIADGGIKEPGHFCKALAVGANIIMAGGLFSGCKESPNQTLRVDGRLFKVMRGAASFSVQQDHGKNPNFVEGMETLVEYQGSVDKVIQRYENGLRSSMSYLNANNLDEFRANASFVQIG